MCKYFIALLLVGSFFQSHSQDNQISVYGEYNMPLGKMKWSYKPSGGIQLHYKRLRDSGRWTLGTGVGIGYTQFKTVADTLYYVVDEGGVQGASLGVAVYSPFKIFMLSGAFSGDRELGKKTSLLLGFDVGYYYGRRTIFLKDANGENGSDELIGRGAFVPKIGLTYDLTDVISIAPYISYTFMIELGSTDSNSMNYNPDTGAIMHYYSTGVALNFSF